MKHLLLAFLLTAATIAGCQQQEQAPPQYQYPSAPIPSGPLQARDDVKMLQDVLKNDPGNLNAWIKLGNTFMDAARYGEAIEAYKKALDIDPSNVDVRVDMGTCYRRTNRSDRAVEEYRKGLEYNPNHAFGHLNLGVVLAYDFNDTVNAIKEFEKYLELSPNAQNAAQVKQEIERLKSL